MTPIPNPATLLTTIKKPATTPLQGGSSIAAVPLSSPQIVKQLPNVPQKPAIPTPVPTPSSIFKGLGNLPTLNTGITPNALTPPKPEAVLQAVTLPGVNFDQITKGAGAKAEQQYANLQDSIYQNITGKSAVDPATLLARANARGGYVDLKQPVDVKIPFVDQSSSLPDNPISQAIKGTIEWPERVALDFQDALASIRGQKLPSLDQKGTYSVDTVAKQFQDLHESMIQGGASENYADWTATLMAAGTGILDLTPLASVLDSGTRAIAAGVLPSTEEQIAAHTLLGSPKTLEQMQANFRSAMQLVHPDKGGSTVLAAELNKARDLLVKSGLPDRSLASQAASKANELLKPITWDDLEGYARRFQGESAPMKGQAWAGTDRQLPGYKFDTPTGRPGFRMGNSIASVKAVGYGEAKAAGETFSGLADSAPRFEIADNTSFLKNHSDGAGNIKPPDIATPTTGKGVNLSDILDHPTLFENYPELKDMKVKIQNLGDGASGAYSAETNSIYMNAAPDNSISSVDEFKSTLLHEAQHAIQEIENLPRGTSPMLAASRLNQKVESQMQELETKMNALSEQVNQERAIFNNRLAASREKNGLMSDAYEKDKTNINQWYRQQPARKARDELTAQYQELTRQADANRTKGFDLYRRSAGEIEARDTAARRNLTPEQRKKIAPYSSQGISSKAALVHYTPEKIVSMAKRVHQQDLSEIRDFLDFVYDEKLAATMKEADILDLETAARRLAERLGVNPNVSNKQLAYTLGNVFDKHEQLFRKGMQKPMMLSTKMPENLPNAEKSLTTNILNKLTGRDSVSAQFISDLTNSPEVKQVEKNLIREVLKDYEGNKNVPVKEFVEKVKSQLLPLKRVATAPKKEPGMGGYQSGHLYEGITLPVELRGRVADYSEHIYESPIKTSAGSVHFGSSASDSYFAHTRTEDLPGINNYTRRVIEIQSDLFQKDRLAAENGGKMHIALTDAERAKIAKEGGTIVERNSKITAIQDARAKEFQKLEPYRNTWYERIIREEIKAAIEDGAGKLQFPTGKTALEIEGLGSEGRWHSVEDKRSLTTDNLQVGKTIHPDSNNMGDFMAAQDEQWIITDVLGEGKFKAMPKEHFDSYAEAAGLRELSGQDLVSYAEQHATENFWRSKETFDISGKVDMENPIFKFYEKPVAKFLKKFDVRPVTDLQGVTWNEVNIKQDTPFKENLNLAFSQKASVNDIALAEETLRMHPARPLIKFVNANGKLSKVDPNLPGVYGPKLVSAMKKAGAKTFQEAQELVDAYYDEEKYVNALRDEVYAGGKTAIAPETGTLEPTINPMSGMTKLGELKMEEEFLIESIYNHPARGLMKYYGNKSPDDYSLSELLVQAEGTKKKSSQLDSIAKEAGYDDMDQAQAGVESLLDMRKNLKGVRAEIKVERANPTRSVTRKIVTQGGDTPVQDPSVYEPIARTPQQLEEETLDMQAQGALEQSGEGGTAKPLRDIVAHSPYDSVKAKVNALDYIRTPDRVLKKIGLGDEAIQIRRAYDAYLKELPDNIDKITKWSEVANKKGSAKRIFEYLDGEPDNDGYVVKLDDPTEMKVAQEIKVWLKQWADRMDLPKDRRLSMYITHIFEKDFIEKEFDSDLAKIIQDKVPGSVYNPFLEERLGAKGYVQDAWRALDAYAKRATRKVHMDPVLEHLKIAAEDLPIESFNYVKKYADRINLRPTEWDNLIDNFLKSIPGIGYKLGQRPVASISRTGRSIVYRGTLGLNFTSALKNLSQGANTYAKLGEKYTVIGYAKLLTHFNDPELEAILGNDMVQDRVISATKKIWQRVDDNLFMFFDAAERVNRGAAYFGAKAKAIAAGKSEEDAIQYGKDIVRDTQFTFGSVDTPVVLQSDIVKLLTQFQSYSVKQAEFLSEMVQKKEWAGLIRYGLAGMVMIMTIGKLWGMKPSDLIPSFRFASIPPVLKPAVETFNAVAGVPDQYGNVPSIPKRIEKVGKSFIPFIPAGVQGKKFYEGYQANQSGASTGASGNIQYTYATTFSNKARAMIFGKSTLPEAQAYFNSDSPLHAAEEKMKPTYVQVQQLVAAGNAEEAQKIVEGMSEDDYAAYKALKTKDKRSDTVKREAVMIGTVRQVQSLLSDGKSDEAQALVDALSDEDYHAYTLAKKRLNIK